MSRTIIASSGQSQKPSPYFSPAVKCAGLVFVSGTAPYSPHTGKLVGETIQEQTAQALRNIEAILADEDDFPGMNEEWLKWFPVDPPARQGAKLPVRVPGLKISIAMIAEA